MSAPLALPEPVVAPPAPGLPVMTSTAGRPSPSPLQAAVSRAAPTSGTANSAFRREMDIGVSLITLEFHVRCGSIAQHLPRHPQRYSPEVPGGDEGASGTPSAIADRHLGEAHPLVHEVHGQDLGIV